MKKLATKTDGLEGKKSIEMLRETLSVGTSLLMGAPFIFALLPAPAVPGAREGIMAVRTAGTP